MKRAATLLYVLLVLIGSDYLSSCKKIVQQQEQNALEAVITNGTWVVTRYLQNDSDITAAFSGYVFQFQSNGVVTGTNGPTVSDGTWTGNISAHTITSNFPAAGYPLNELNAIWTITDSYTDSVAATTTLDSATNILNLHKQ
jgi:hypothetical protein